MSSGKKSKKSKKSSEMSKYWNGDTDDAEAQPLVRKAQVQVQPLDVELPNTVGPSAEAHRGWFGFVGPREAWNQLRAEGYGALPLATCGCFTMAFILGLVWAFNGALVSTMDMFGKHSFHDKPHAITSLGTLRGIRQDVVSADEKKSTINAFLGVPFAEQGIHNVDQEKPVCIQAPGPNPFVSHKTKQSEDCLHLNVWTPSRSSTFGSDRLPVLVFVHGGGLTKGSGNANQFDGGNLAASAHLVVVTLNYRLGPLGFMVGVDAQDDEEGNGGMNGFNDIIVAMQWVRAHVGAFGGDPERITLMGHGCGAVAACTIGASPRAEGLFQNLILQSGTCASFGPNIQLGSVGLNHSQQLLRNLGVSMREELLKVDPEKLVWPEGAGTGKCMAFVDGYVASDLPYNMYLNGYSNVQRVMTGATSMDSMDGVRLDFEGGFVPNANDEAGYHYYLEQTYGAGMADVVAARYPLDHYNNNSAAAFLQAQADERLICPSLQFAAMMQTLMSTRQSFHYVFGFGPENSDLAVEAGLVTPMSKRSKHWASHGSELPFIFHQPCRRCTYPDGPACQSDGTICVGGEEGGRWSGASRLMSRQAIQYWGSFAAGVGVPESDVTGSEFDWSPVTASGARMQTMYLDSSPGPYIQMGYRSALCAFWNAQSSNRR